MRYTYQYLVLEANGRVTTDKEQIDASAWLDYLAAHTDRYGNLGEFVTAALAALPTQDPLVASAITADIDELFCTQQPTAVFQFAMYCWEEFRAGRLSAQAWSAVLGTAWDCGERAMLDHIPLNSAQVVQMFEAADKDTLFRVTARRDDWASFFAGLPDLIPVYRGITTALKYRENGLCWTTLSEKAKQLSGQNVKTADDIPGVVAALVPKTAVLAFFGQGDELVINPAIAKEHQETHYLSGTGLSKFRQNWKKWQAAEKKRREE